MMSRTKKYNKNKGFYEKICLANVVCRFVWNLWLAWNDGRKHEEQARTSRSKKFKPKLLVLDFIRFGNTIDEIREFHDILMSQDTCLVEFVVNLDKINQKKFYIMALPIKFQNLDSSFCRAIVIQKKS